MNREFRSGSLEEDPTGITEMARKVTIDPSYSLASRITALQVLSSFDREAATMIALELVEDRSSSPMMLVSSLGVLKDTGREFPVGAIEDMRVHPDSRVRRAAENVKEANSHNISVQ